MGEGPDKNYVRSTTYSTFDNIWRFSCLSCEVNFKVPSMIILLRHSSLSAPTITDAEQPSTQIENHYVFATRNITAISTSGITWSLNTLTDSGVQEYFEEACSLSHQTLRFRNHRNHRSSCLSMMTHGTQNELCGDVKRPIDLEPTRCQKNQPLSRTRIFGTHHLEKLSLDISAHVCPKRFIKELQYVFPNCDLTDVIAIPTMQFAKNELVNIGDEIEVEKDRLLERVS